jgi:hypothetical protein
MVALKDTTGSGQTNKLLSVILVFFLRMYIFIMHTNNTMFSNNTLLTIGKVLCHKVDFYGYLSVQQYGIKNPFWSSVWYLAWAAMATIPRVLVFGRVKNETNWYSDSRDNGLNIML